MPSDTVARQRVRASRRSRPRPKQPERMTLWSRLTVVTGGRPIQEGVWLFIVVAIPLIIDPWGLQVFDLPKVAILRVAVALLALLLGYRSIIAPPTLSKRMRIPWRDPRLWAAALGLVAAAASLVSLDRNLSFWGSYAHQEGLYTTLSYLLLFGLVATELRELKQATRLVFAVALGSILPVAYGLLQGAGFDPIPWQTTGRTAILSTLGRSNFVGSYLVLSIPLTVAAVLLCPRRWLQLLMALNLAGSVALLWLTKARSAWLAIAIALALILALRAITRGRRRRIVFHAAIAGLLLVLVSAALFGALSAAGQIQAGSFLRLPEMTGSLAARLTIWKASLHLVAERPLLGFGPDNFTLAFYHVFPPELVFYQGRAITDRAHNILLEQAVATGLLGLTAYLALVISLVATIERRLSLAKGESGIVLGALFAAAIGHLVDLLSSFEIAGTAAVFWVVAGAGVGLCRAVAADQPHEQSPDPVDLATVGAGLQPTSPRIASPIASSFEAVIHALLGTTKDKDTADPHPGPLPARARERTRPLSRPSADGYPLGAEKVRVRAPGTGQASSSGKAPISREGQIPKQAKGLRSRRGLLAAGSVALAGFVVLVINIVPLVADTYAGLALNPASALQARLANAERSAGLWPLEPGHLIQLGLLYLERAGSEADPRSTLKTAESKLIEATTRRPLDPLAWSALGDVRSYWAVKMRDERVFFAAEEAYQRAVDLAPSMATLHASYGALEISGGRPAIAVKTLERATALDTTDARAWYFLAEAYRALGRKGDADQAAAISQRLDADARRESN